MTWPSVWFDTDDDLPVDARGGLHPGYEPDGYYNVAPGLSDELKIGYPGDGP
jgi:hypothetical protein